MLALRCNLIQMLAAYHLLYLQLKHSSLHEPLQHLGGQYLMWRGSDRLFRAAGTGRALHSSVWASRKQHNPCKPSVASLHMPATQLSAPGLHPQRQPSPLPGTAVSSSRGTRPQLPQSSGRYSQSAVAAWGSGAGGNQQRVQQQRSATPAERCQQSEVQAEVRTPS